MKKITFFIFFICSAAAINVDAQKVYDSLYSVRPGVIGRAVFTYKGEDDDKIKDGEFRFESDDQTAKDSIIFFLKENWQGSYRKNLKQGLWNYTIKADIFFVRGVEGQNLHYKLLSEKAFLKAKYEKGIPSGDWDYLKTSQEKGEEEKVVQDIQVNFKEGKLEGDVFCTIADSSEKVVISGQAVNGLFDGIWKFSHDTILEIRNYNHGILLDFNLIREEDTLQRLIFPLSEKLEKLLSDTQKLALAKPSGKLIFQDGYSNKSDYVLSQRHGNHYLKLMLRQLHQYDIKIFNEKKYSIGTYRAKYPFTDQEKIWMKQLDSLIIAYRTLLKSISDEEVLNLKYSKDDIIVLVLNWLEFEEKILNQMEDHTGEFRTYSLEWTYREGLITDSARNILRKSIIHVKGDTVVFKYGEEAENEKNLLAYMLSNYADRMKVADSLKKQFLVKVKSLNIDQAIILRNDKITSLINELDSSIKANTRDPSLNKLVKKVHDHYLMDVVNKEYQAFLSEVDDKERKAVIGDSILLELHSIEAVYTLCHKIAIRRREIDSLYTEYTFDPFTFTDQVPSRIKRRLYDLIAVQMFNQLVAKATNEKDVFECERDLRFLYENQPILIELKDRDTKKLEKKLKRHKSLDERIAILNEELR